MNKFKFWDEAESLFHGCIVGICVIYEFYGGASCAAMVAILGAIRRN